jgi:hypothetical protein
MTRPIVTTRRVGWAESSRRAHEAAPALLFKGGLILGVLAAVCGPQTWARGLAIAAIGLLWLVFRELCALRRQKPASADRPGASNQHDQVG